MSNRTRDNNKSKYLEELHEDPTFDDLPLRVVAAFLEPLELLACMSVNKATRPIAGRALNEYKYDPATLAQRMMFKQWLKDPSISPENRVFEEEMSAQVYDRRKLAGPLRLNAIKQMPHLEKKFVILKYERTYRKELSQVAILSDEGSLVSIYDFSCDAYSEGYLTGREGTFNSSGWNEGVFSEVRFLNSGSLPPFLYGNGGPWNFAGSNILLNLKDPPGFAPGGNFSLYRLFQGCMSPTETTFVLMHALSSDPRTIYTYSETVFDLLDFCIIIVHIEGVNETWEQWKAELHSIEYADI